jgi:hypothetical protein
MGFAHHKKPPAGDDHDDFPLSCSFYNQYMYKPYFYDRRRAVWRKSSVKFFYKKKVLLSLFGRTK